MGFLWVGGGGGRGETTETSSVWTSGFSGTIGREVAVIGAGLDSQIFRRFEIEVAWVGSWVTSSLEPLLSIEVMVKTPDEPWLLLVESEETEPMLVFFFGLAPPPPLSFLELRFTLFSLKDSKSSLTS